MKIRVIFSILLTVTIQIIQNYYTEKNPNHLNKNQCIISKINLMDNRTENPTEIIRLMLTIF